MKKKVLHVTACMDFGGVETHLTTISTQQSPHFEHAFLAITRGGSAGDAITQNGASFHAMGCPARPSPKTIYKLYRYFRQLKPVVVHTHGSEANIQALLAAWLAGVPVRIGEEIGIPSHSSKAKFFFRQAYRFASKVIGVSEAVRNWLVEHREVPATKATILYNPVRLPAARQREDQPANLRIGCVGRLEPVKNPLALLDAFASLTAGHAGAELWFIGDGSQKALLMQRAGELGVGVGHKVVFHGFQSAPERFIRQCSLYVQPSVSEGFGLALVEAMGCAVPVLATAVGGAPEIIEHGATGWLTDRTDSQSLASALRDVLQHPEEHLTAIGQAGRMAVARRFQPSEYMNALESLYHRELEAL